ncbi:MAG: hypothetical protein H7X93_11130 [Sphingomonadaceae bacterium]|nr:hypothetical protein [Sphingomonadaceae bacterium]
MRRFARFACLDWSGAKSQKQAGIALAIAGAGAKAPALVASEGGWSREAALDWLRERAAEGADMLIGIDFSPALPFADKGAYFPGWAESPRDARSLWALVDRLSESDPHLAANGALAHLEIRRHFRQYPECGDLFGQGIGRLRETEQRADANPASCFNLVGAKQVGKSSLTGMRVLHRLAGAIPIWPFDPAPGRGLLLVEIYTSIAARAAGRPAGRSKMRDKESLNIALGSLGSQPHPGLTRYDDHSTDALVTAAWLRKVAGNEALWNPAGLTPDLRRTEGWTFGVG